MGSILLKTLLGNGETLADLRSPILPVPEDHPHVSRRQTAAEAAIVQPRALRVARPRPLTERSLRAYHLAWLVRQRDLRSRHVALCDARDKGWPSCWAGKATSRHIRAVSRALDEAEWVEEKLRKGVQWCRVAAVPKAPVKTLLKSGKKSPVSRPTHADFPPSLLDLPYPLPFALEANIYFLTVPRPPSLTRRDEEGEAQRRDAPPAYREVVDCELGEIVLEVGEMDNDIHVRAYERQTHTAPLDTAEIVVANA